MRKTIIAGNWKLNKTATETKELTEGLKELLKDITEVDMVICPPFTSLNAASEIIKDSPIALGAQNMFWEENGAFTGEISASMLKDAGATFVILGHSERRQFFGETNETVNKKLKSALAAGLNPIVCVGENLEQRESNKTFDIVKNHVQNSLAGLSNEEMKKTIIAYEPVWAIGTGKTATKEQAQEVHQYIRKLFGEVFDEETASVVRIQYGGSVKPDNAAGLISQPDIDGALVGGASLKVDSFTQIIKNCLGVKA